MANNIFQYKDLKIGNSVYEKNVGKIINEIFSHAESKKCKIFFFNDVKDGKNLNDKSF